MTLLVIGLLFTLVLFIVLGFIGGKGTGWKRNKGQLLCIIPLAVFIICSCAVSIPAGHTGVVTTFGRVENVILSEGLNFKLPWQEVVKMDNRVQRESFQLEAFSSDIQQTNVIGSVNFSVDRKSSQNLYREVGSNYYLTVIYPRIMEDIKVVFASYTAESLVANRDTLSSRSLTLLQNDMRDYGININTLNIENIDFTDEFTEAVEAKQVAEQEKIRTSTQQEAAIIVAEADAKQQVIAAEAAAEVAKVKADAEAYATRVNAEAEAEANKAVAKSLTPELIEYQKVLKWNGSVPTVQAGEGTYPIISLGE